MVLVGRQFVHRAMAVHDGGVCRDERRVCHGHIRQVLQQVLFLASELLVDLHVRQLYLQLVCRSRQNYVVCERLVSAFLEAVVLIFGKHGHCTRILGQVCLRVDLLDDVLLSISQEWILPTDARRVCEGLVDREDAILMQHVRLMVRRR